MKSKNDKDDKKEFNEKVNTKSVIEIKNEEDTPSIELKSSPFWTKSASNQNGFCPKSVRNHFKNAEKTKEKLLCLDGDNKNITDKAFGDESIKSSITKVATNLTISISKINNEVEDLSVNTVKHTITKPSLIYSSNILKSEESKSGEYGKNMSKNKKKKKHSKSKVQDVSDNECKDTSKKTKKSHKSKKKKNKDLDIAKSHVFDDIKKESKLCDDTVEIKNDELHKSFLVSYSSDEDDLILEPVVPNRSPERKLEYINNSFASTIKSENKIEIKLKPTKSPGKSTWESSESEIETESKKGLIETDILHPESPKELISLPNVKKSKSSSKSPKSANKSPSEHQSTSRSVSQNSSYSSSQSSSYSGYSRRSSRSYSRSRSHSKSKRRSKRRKHYSSSSSSYSRSRSRYRSRSSSRSTSYSRSSRSYTRSRSRYKSSYSSKYRSRSRSHSSRSRSNSYYRSSFRKRKRSSSTDRFLNIPTRRVKTAPTRNSILQGGPHRHVDIGKKIDAIKESQRKAFEAQSNENVSSLNIPLPPDKPKGTLFKINESYSSIDLSGPPVKKQKKNITGTKTNIDMKVKEKLDTNPLQFLQSNDCSYIGPQVSSDLAKKLGLDVKANSSLVKKEKIRDKEKIEPITSDSFVAPTLDAAQLALQSRAYQHRLYSLQGSTTNQEVAAQSAQYYHPMYMSASSLSNNLTAIASAAVANEQLPASVAGSLAQAAVQRIMSSSNLTATYNTPSAASLQNAFQHGIPQTCGTLMANTPSGLIPISLLQQGGFQVGLNPLVFQQLQQQNLNAQFGQTISLPNQHILSGVNQFLLQASNQQALLQSLGVNAQAQLLGSPLNFQQTLLLAAQQQQQQQLFAAAQINQATLQAAHLQAQIQAQARALSLQNLQQAAQMQSSAQNAAATITMTNTTDNIVESNQKHENGNQIVNNIEKSSLEGAYIFSDQNVSFSDNNHMIQKSDNLVTTLPNEIDLDRLGSAPEYDNVGNYSSVQKSTQRMVYSGPALMESIDMLSPPISKS